MGRRLAGGLAPFVLLLLGQTSGAEAQCVAPVAFSASGLPASNRAANPRVLPLASPTESASRGEHVIFGAMAGAVMGGLTLAIANHTIVPAKASRTPPCSPAARSSAPW